jgi:hypothetical protein
MTRLTLTAPAACQAAAEAFAVADPVVAPPVMA